MARAIDLSSLTPAERVVFGGGALLFASGFVPWWFRTDLAEATVTHNAGLTMWSTAGVAAGAVAAVLVLLRASIWPSPAPAKDGVVYALLGLAGIATCAIGASTTHGAWLGSYAGIALAAVLVLGGLRRRRERRAGWT